MPQPRNTSKTNVRSSLSPAIGSVLHPATSEPHSLKRLVLIRPCGSAKQDIREALREFPLHVTKKINPRADLESAERPSRGSLGLTWSEKNLGGM
jgi:hypothetical protein